MISLILEGISYGSYRDNNPKETVELLCSHLYPPKLREVITRKVEFDQDMKNNVKIFIQSTCVDVQRAGKSP